MSNVERSCSVCLLPEREVGPLMVAADDGRVVAGGFKPGAPVPSSDPRDVVDYENAGRRVRRGDLVCWRHVAVRPDGNYVRVEGGG